MGKAIIALGYKHIIDATATTAFEKDVHNDTYSEFLMQAPRYNQNGQLTTLAAMIAEEPKANSLHYKVGFAIGLYVKALNGIAKGFNDTLGHPVRFETFLFEIIHSDTTNKSSHTVALVYVTGKLTLVDSFGEYLLLSKEGEENTFMIRIQEGLSIISYEPITA